MIVSKVNAHVVSTWHVTLLAFCAFSHLVKDFPVLPKDWLSLFPFFLVKVMVSCVILVRSMALETKIVPFLVEFKAVNIVTVTASDSPLVHFALRKRAVNIHLFQNLTVREIHAFVKELGYHVIH
jgi:hypothetical protein